MASQGTLEFVGLSGKKYTFTMYSITQAFTAVGGVYAFVKKYVKDGKSRYAPLYVGITGDLSTRFDNHHKEDCYMREGANMICVMREDNEESRRAIETDLIEGYTWPCNG